MFLVQSVSPQFLLIDRTCIPADEHLAIVAFVDRHANCAKPTLSRIRASNDIRSLGNMSKQEQKSSFIPLILYVPGVFFFISPARMYG